MDVLLGRDQLPVFVSFVVCGIISGAFYDILKIKRRIFAQRFIFLFVDDLIFCTFCTILVIFNAYSFNDGNLKWYEIPFMMMGFVLYRKTASPLFIGICYYIIDVTKKIVRFVLSPVKAFVLHLQKITKKCTQKVYLDGVCYRKKKRMSCWRFM